MDILNNENDALWHLAMNVDNDDWLDEYQDLDIRTIPLNTYKLLYVLNRTSLKSQEGESKFGVLDMMDQNLMFDVTRSILSDRIDICRYITEIEPQLSVYEL